MKLSSFRFFSNKKDPEEDYNPFPDLTPNKKPHKVKTEYLILSFALTIFFVSLSFYVTKIPQDSISDNSSSPQVQAISTPKPLPSGKRIYNGSHGSNVVGPKPTQIIIDPIDPELGDKQTLTLKIPHDKPITKTLTVLITDNQSTDLTLTNTSTDLWVAEWEVEDTYNYNYQIQLFLSDAEETFTGALTFR